jgi:Flp pilus assembly protein TadD
VIAAAGWAALASRRVRIATVAILALAGTLGVRAAVRTTAWLDDRRLYESMVSSDPANASAHHNLGNLRAASGDLAGAIAAWEAAVLLNPRHAGAHNNLGNAYAMTGRYARARPHYQAVRELDPGEALALYNLARLADLEGRAGEAAVLYRAYLANERRAGDPQRAVLLSRARDRLASLEAPSPGPATVPVR